MFIVSGVHHYRREGAYFHQRALFSVRQITNLLGARRGTVLIILTRHAMPNKYLCTGHDLQRDALSPRCTSIKVPRPGIGAPFIGKTERKLVAPFSISRVDQRARTGMSSALLGPIDTCTFATMRANRLPVRPSDIRPDRLRVDPAETHGRIRRDRCAKLGTSLLL